MDSDGIAKTILRDREKGASQLEATYREPLYSVAFSLCHDPTEAEDLVLRTIEQVIAKIDTYEEQDSFYNWMCVILKNLYIDSRRRKTLKGTISVGGPKEMEAFVQPVDADAIVENVDAEIVRRAIEKLPPKMREVLILHYFMDMPVKQIARTLRLAHGTVLSRLHHARRVLARRLGEAAKKPAAVLALTGLVALGAMAIAVIGGGLFGDRSGSKSVIAKETHAPREVAFKWPDVKWPAAETTTRLEETPIIEEAPIIASAPAEPPLANTAEDSDTSDMDEISLSEVSFSPNQQYGEAEVSLLAKNQNGASDISFSANQQDGEATMNMQTIKTTARQAVLAAAVATTATAAWAADAYWTGATDNYFKTAGNWDINAKPTSQTTFFQASKFNSRFTENEVVFDSAFSISKQFSVRAVGTAENPLVWRATDAANGLKSTANNSLIGWNTGDAYLKIVNGTWQVAGTALEIGKTNKGWLYLKDINSFTVSGNNNCLKIDNGSTLILDGGTASVGKNMELGGNVANKSATYIQKNGTLTVSGDIYLGKNSSSTSGDLYFELGGGTVTAGAIAHGDGTAPAKVKFDGGTLKQRDSNPYANGVLQYNAKLTAVVGSKGGTIDSNNKAIYIGAPIGNADGEVGGMRFKGGNTITFKDTATPTYTGGTTVELGTKLVASTDAARDAILGNLIVDGLHQVTAQDFTVFEYSGGGLSKDNVSFANCGPATYAEVVGNTIVVHFDPGWVGTSAAVKVFPGKTLSDIEYGIFTSRFGGKASTDANRYTPNSAGGYNVKRYYDDGGSVTNMVVEFQVKEGSTVKCVVVEFTDDGTDVYAKALGGRAKANVDLGYVFLEQNRTTWHGDGPYDVVTNITDYYYGVFDLRVKLPVSWTLDANKNWSTLRNGATLASDEVVRITVTGNKPTLTIDEDVDIGRIMFVNGSSAIFKVATGCTLEADSITGLGFPWVDSGAMLYVDGTVDATSLKNDGTVVKRVAGDVSIPINNDSTGTTIVSNGTLKVSKKYASGTTHTIRVVSGARFDMNGVQDVTAKFVLENGATFANTGAEIDGKKAQAVSLTLEGNATAAFSNNFGLIGPSYGKTTLALGSNTLTLNGSNKDFWLCNTEITGDGTIYVEHGWLHPTNTASVGAACTLNIPSGGALNLEADLTVANFVNGANNGNIKGGNTLTVTGQLTPGSAAIPKLTLANGATVKATGTAQTVSTTFVASGTITVDASEITKEQLNAAETGVAVLIVPTAQVPSGVPSVSGAPIDGTRAKWVEDEDGATKTLRLFKPVGLMVIFR